MSILDRRRQLQQQIAQLPDDQLTQVEQYLAFLNFQKTVPSQSEVTKSPSTGASILASLEQAHTPPDSPPLSQTLAQPPEDFAAKIALRTYALYKLSIMCMTEFGRFRRTSDRPQTE